MGLMMRFNYVEDIGATRLAIDDNGNHWEYIEDLNDELDDEGNEITGNAWRCQETGQLIADEHVEYFVGN